MQLMVNMLQIVTLGAAVLLGFLLLITILRLRKLKTTDRELRVQIEEGTDL